VSPKQEKFRQRLARRPLWTANPELFEAVLQILVHYDLFGICGHDQGATEYAPEVGTILPRLKEAASAADLHQIVQQEFVRWFGHSAHRHMERYRRIAGDLWNVLQEPTFQQQLMTIPDAVPNQAISLIANLLDNYPDPQVHINIADVLRTYAE